MYRIPLVKLSIVRDGSIKTSSAMRSAVDVAALLSGWIGNEDREHFVLLCLDSKNKMIAAHEVSVGSLAASLVHPREVFKAAILSNAAAIIIAHNHPSGDPTPSAEDREITARLAEAGRLLGIPVVDHVVIGSDGGYRSFAESGLL